MVTQWLACSIMVIVQCEISAGDCVLCLVSDCRAVAFEDLMAMRMMMAVFRLLCHVVW
jgi:hypothetical protein